MVREALEESVAAVVPEADRELNLFVLIGGPDGLAPNCLMIAHQKWSLGPLTLPHALVRIVLAEQLYRAVSMLGNHPYHRAPPSTG